MSSNLITRSNLQNDESRGSPRLSSFWTWLKSQVADEAPEGAVTGGLQGRGEQAFWGRGGAGVQPNLASQALSLDGVFSKNQLTSFSVRHSGRPENKKYLSAVDCSLNVLYLEH